MTNHLIHLDAGGRLTRILLRSGMAAGPLYIVVGLAQALTRDGFDMRRHAISQLSNGALGWIQIANFLVSGVLVISGAVGVHRTLNGGWGGTWGSILLGVYGVGLIGGGCLWPTPGLGFPPGTPMQSTGMSRDGLLHFIFGGIGFYGLIAACFVFSRRFHRLRQTAWAVYSALSGAAFFSSFAAIASGSTAPATILIFYAAVAWIWVWHSALLAHLLHDLRQDTPESTRDDSHALSL